MHQDVPALIQMLHNGNTKAMKLLVIFDYHDLFNFSIKITKNKEETEEIIQDAYVALWLKITEFSSFLSIRKYLFKVVKNRSISAVQNHKIRMKNVKRYAYLSTEVFETSEDAITKEIHLQNMENEIEKLPPRSKTAISLMMIGKPVKEIAVAMSIKESSVRSIKERVVASLRKKIVKFIA